MWGAGFASEKAAGAYLATCDDRCCTALMGRGPIAFVVMNSANRTTKRSCSAQIHTRLVVEGSQACVGVIEQLLGLVMAHELILNPECQNAWSSSKRSPPRCSSLAFGQIWVPNVVKFRRVEDKGEVSYRLAVDEWLARGAFTEMTKEIHGPLYPPDIEG